MSHFSRLTSGTGHLCLRTITKQLEGIGIMFVLQRLSASTVFFQDQQIKLESREHFDLGWSETTGFLQLSYFVLVVFFCFFLLALKSLATCSTCVRIFTICCRCSSCLGDLEKQIRVQKSHCGRVSVIIVYRASLKTMKRFD